MAYLTIPLLELSLGGIIYHPPVPNTVMENSKFIRLGYSNPDFTLNGMHIVISGVAPSRDYARGKPQCAFVYEQNKNWLDALIRLERTILARIDDRKQSFRLRDQIVGGHVKLSNSSVGFTSMILKISGIWVTSTSCGITYKFVPAS